tara:strand:- start:1142 stop:1639 length:498 start_codon:yes stop_codon:yes gene_type:complete
MPKRIPHEVRNKAMQLYLEGRAAKDIASVITKDSNVTVKPSTIYAWANQYNWGATRTVARADAVIQIKETETQRYARLQEEHLNTYEGLRKKAASELQAHMFDRPFDAARALDLGIKGERTVMEGMINLQFIQDVMSVLLDEIQDQDILSRIAIKLKTLVQVEKE